MDHICWPTWIGVKFPGIQDIEGLLCSSNWWEKVNFHLTKPVFSVHFFWFEVFWGWKTEIFILFIGTLVRSRNFSNISISIFDRLPFISFISAVFPP